MTWELRLCSYCRGSMAKQNTLWYWLEKHVWLGIYISGPIRVVLNASLKCLVKIFPNLTGWRLLMWQLEDVFLVSKTLCELRHVSSIFEIVDNVWRNTKIISNRFRKWCNSEVWISIGHIYIKIWWDGAFKRINVAA